MSKVLYLSVAKLKPQVLRQFGRFYTKCITILEDVMYCAVLKEK